MTTKKQTARVSIGWMQTRHIEEVGAIESHNGDFQWSEEVFRHHLRQRNIIGMVANLISEDRGEGNTVAFMVYALEKNSLAVLNFAVHPQWRRLGVGRQMVARLVSKLSSHRRTKIVLNAHGSKLDLQLFLRAMGFLSDGICGEFYVMVRRLDDAPDEPVNRIAAFLDDE